MTAANKWTHSKDGSLAHKDSDHSELFYQRCHRRSRGLEDNETMRQWWRCIAAIQSNYKLQC